MIRIKPSQDIRPLSEFRAHVATFIQHVNKTNRPLVITNHGKSSVVLLNVAAYEKLIEQIDLLEDIHDAERQIKTGRGISHRLAKQRLLHTTSK